MRTTAFIFATIYAGIALWVLVGAWKHRHDPRPDRQPWDDIF